MLRVSRQEHRQDFRPSPKPAQWVLTTEFLGPLDTADGMTDHVTIVQPRLHATVHSPRPSLALHGKPVHPREALVYKPY
jgi:hypothetical protein